MRRLVFDQHIHQAIGALAHVAQAACVFEQLLLRDSPAILELRRLLNKAIKSDGGWPASVDRSEGGRRATLPEEKQIQILMRVNDDCRRWKDWIFRDD